MVQSGPWVDGSWVMGQMGHVNRWVNGSWVSDTMGQMGHGSPMVTHGPPWYGLVSCTTSS